MIFSLQAIRGTFTLTFGYFGYGYPRTQCFVPDTAIYMVHDTPAFNL